LTIRLDCCPRLCDVPAWATSQPRIECSTRLGFPLLRHLCRPLHLLSHAAPLIWERYDDGQLGHPCVVDVPADDVVVRRAVAALGVMNCVEQSPQHFAACRCHAVGQHAHLEASGPACDSLLRLCHCQV
jgi:hypothetical protein